MKELEDYSWFPPVLRNFQTEFIGYVVSTFGVYNVFIRHLKTLPMSVQPMTDLCSGSGEPAISIFKRSNCFSRLSLSDKYPNTSKWHDDNITYEIVSTDVLKMDFTPGTYYTMFNAFHHFGDEEKLKIVQKILQSGSGAFIVEILEPTIFCLLKVFFITTIGSFFLTPFIQPITIKRLFFTYVIPINIITITYDGIVSVLKSRSIKQYQKFLESNGNDINIFRLQKGLSSLIVIQIEPKR